MLGLAERRKEQRIKTLLAVSRALVARMHAGARPVAAAASRPGRPQFRELAQGVEREQGGPAARSFRLRRGRHPEIQRIGEHLTPRR